LNDDLKCKLCGREYEHASTLYKHIKDKHGDEPYISIDNTTNIEKQQNIEQHNNNVNVEVEGDFNVDGDVKVVKFGEENLSYISDDTFKKIIGRGFKSLEEFMNHVHFNKDHPENHNIYVASMKDGHVVTYDGKQWKVGLADQMLDDLIQQKSDILEEKYDELSDKLSPMESKKFNNFMNRKDDEKVNLKLKRELRVQLYNNRHFGKDARKLLEEQAKTIKPLLLPETNKRIEESAELSDEDIIEIIQKLRCSNKEKLDEIKSLL
jgi:hypothetical protein